MVTESANPIATDQLTTDEANDLIREVIGHQRATAESAAVRNLINACARSPLALRIVASRIAAWPDTTVATIVDDITDEGRQLDTVNSDGDDHGAVRTVFDWLYTRLPTDRARTLRRLGVHPGPELGIHAAAAVAGINLSTADQHLEDLADMHLIDRIGNRRYRLHSLLHSYAAHCADRDDTPDDRRRSRTAVLSWYADTARSADKLVFPGLSHLEVELDPTDNAIVLDDRGRALAWLNGEQANLMTALRAAVQHDQYGVALVLASTARFLILRERTLWTVRAEAESLGLAAARASQDRAAEAFLLGFRGETLTGLGRLDEAEADFSAQLVLAQELDDPISRRFGLGGLGQIRLQQNRYPEAKRYYQQALPFARRSVDRRPEAVVECNLSQICIRLGHYDQALRHAERELLLRRESPDRVGEAYALYDVAVARQSLGDDEAAIEQADSAIGMYRALDGTERYLAAALETASISLERTGNPRRSVEYLREACTILTELDSPLTQDMLDRWRALEARASSSTDK